MSLLTQLERNALRRNFQQLPFHPRNKGRSPKHEYFYQLKLWYEFWVEITTHRGSFLMTYLMKGLGLTPPILDSIVFGMKHKSRVFSTTLYDHLKGYCKNNKRPQLLPRKEKLIYSPFVESYLEKFVKLRIEKLSNEELYYWFMRVTHSKDQYRVDDHWHPKRFKAYVDSLNDGKYLNYIPDQEKRQMHDVVVYTLKKRQILLLGGP